MRTVDVAGLAVGDDAPPRIMGVLNVSPESPYSPSVFEDPGDAAAYADELIEEGADIIDVGLESANKRFPVQSAEWELDRLDLAVNTIDRISNDAVLSIETRYSTVAEAALARGFDMVNDICGFADPEMPAVCEDSDAAVVKMAGPGDLTRPGALEDVDEIYTALADGLTAKTIIDPAFGGWSDAKTLADDTEIFQRLREFRAIGHPILVSINRKNFIRKPLGRSTARALPGSLAATSLAVERGAHVIRTHDVAETRDAAFIGDRFARSRVRTSRVEELDITTPQEAQRYLERFGSNGEESKGVVTRIFEVGPLEVDERTELTGAIESVNAIGFVNGDRVFVAGTVGALHRLVDTLDALPDVAEGIRSGL